MGRTVSVCGAMGVRMTASVPGASSGPPAESEYAVEPVGVAKISPSAQYVLSGAPPARTSISSRPVAPLRSTTNSLSAQRAERSGASPSP